MPPTNAPLLERNSLSADVDKKVYNPFHSQWVGRKAGVELSRIPRPRQHLNFPVLTIVPAIARGEFLTQAASCRSALRVEFLLPGD